jgi:hypothetical protein
MTQGYSANESEPPSNSCDRRSIAARDSSLSTTWEMKSGRGIGQKATGIVQSEGWVSAAKFREVEPRTLHSIDYVSSPALLLQNHIQARSVL